MIQYGKCIPTKKQLDFLSWEFGVFFHFGIRTFYEGHVDWDMKEMPAEQFNPTEFSAEQWCETVAKAGAKYAILTCKHHDGFALWPSKYTEYSVKNTPWKDGKGDVVKEFTDACRKYGLKVGLYYSPAQFGSKDTVSTDYDEYFINQISELLGNYGQVDYLWFDGCGSENHNYDEKRIVNCIRTLQPGILLFNMWDPDTRWCGNELGYAPYPNYNVTDTFSLSVLSEQDDALETPQFLPLECDCRIRNHWFYGENDKDNLKSLDQLMGMYYLSVGRGANLLLNVGPDHRGLLTEDETARLLEFGEEIQRRFKEPLEAKLVENKEETWFELEFGSDFPVNHLVIEEDLTDGEAVDEFSIELSYTWMKNKRYSVYYGKTIGNKAICSFPTGVCDKIRLNILKSTGGYKLKSINAYYVK